MLHTCMSRVVLYKTYVKFKKLTKKSRHVLSRFHPSLRANERASQKIKLLYKFIY